LTRLPAIPLLASRISAVPPVCRAKAELFRMPEEGLAGAVVEDPVEALVPLVAGAVDELEELEELLGAVEALEGQSAENCRSRSRNRRPPRCCPRP